MARVNARMNQLAVEFRADDLLEPVRGERFDLVVSQPPYVALPPGRRATTYLHGGPLGEELSLRFAAAFPGATREGGLGVLHFDSPAIPGRPLVERVRAALAGAPVDLVALTAPGPSPDLQAAAYGALEDPALGSIYRQEVRRYREHLARSGIESFSRAVVVPRPARPGRSGFAAQVPVSLDRLSASDLQRLLRGLDGAAADAETLLCARVRPAAGAQLVERRPLGPGGPGVRLALQFAVGPAVEQELTEASRVLLELLEQSPTVSRAIDAYARACAAPRESVVSQVLSAVRDGLARGAISMEA